MELSEAKSLLSRMKPSFISMGDELPLETIELLRELYKKKGGASFIKSCFKTYPRGAWVNKGIICTYVCPLCGNTITESLLPSEILFLVSNNKEHAEIRRFKISGPECSKLYWKLGFVCKNCFETHKDDYVKKIKQLEIEREEEQKAIAAQRYIANGWPVPLELRPVNEIAKNTFIQKYLLVTSDIDMNIPVSAFEEMKEEYEKCNKDEVIAAIKELSYNTFLVTPYWRIISSYVKLYAGESCMVCMSKNSLRAHHRTYEHHGEEIKYWRSDLICLCNNCHEKFHTK